MHQAILVLARIQGGLWITLVAIPVNAAIAYVLIYTLALSLGWFPSYGYVSPGVSLRITS